jgi:uncharacterized repeat protein (TIGR01451 family)
MGRRFLRHVLFAGALLCLGAAAEAAPPPAGTVITNTASGLYTDSTTLHQVGIGSNTVSAAVAAAGTPLIAATVSSPSGSSTPGAALALTASADNTGTTAQPIMVSVNGAPANLVMLTFQVPANTTFTSAHALTGSTQVLYHVLGTAANAWVSAPPAGAVIDAVAFAVATLPTGALLSGQLNLTVNANASTAISAAAVAGWAATAGGTAQSTPSNTLTITLPVIAPTIGYYTSGTYATGSVSGQPGSPLYLQVNAALCNNNPAQALSVPVTITSRLTGDVQTFNAVETGPNTGVFRIQPDVPTANAATGAAGNGVLAVLPNDVVTASVTHCAGGTVSATTTLLIDPSGVVYNSHSNQPLAGTTVELIDVTGAGNGGHAGGPARVLESDGVTAAPSSVVTTASGSYAFPVVAPSTYRLVVTAPGGYVFPSLLPPAQQPAGRLIDPLGSYGKNFVIAGSQDAAVHFDVPLDPGVAPGSLLIQKTADKLTAELGDFVDYTVQVNNNTGAALPATQVSDELPAGFTYLHGSARLNGVRIADPAGGSGPALSFALGALPKAAQVTLTYRVRIGAGAQGGTGTNLAQAVSGHVVSNHASATVQITGGVFSNDAYLIGKVFADCNGNGIQDPGEPGIPGVRIYLEDGTYVVSDEDGKYSLYGLTPRMHVAKVDLTTLPAGTRVEVLNNRNAFDGGSAFVDLTNGELHKTDFALAGCSTDLATQIAARRQALTNPSEILQAAQGLLSPNATSTTIDQRTLPASGVIRLPGAPDATTGSNTLLPQAPLTSGMAGISPFAPAAAPLGAVGDPGGPYAPQAQGQPQRLSTSAAQLLEQQAPAPPVPDDSNYADFRALQTQLRTEALEEVLPQLDARVGFVNLKDGDVLPIAQTRVQVKGPLGTHLELTVNGQTLPDSQVGKKSTLEKTGVLALEYIGVNLKAGRNELRVRALDDFGNVRGSAAIGVLAPGALASIILEAPAAAIADAATAVPVKVLLRDADGLPVAARTLLTLNASLGRWLLPTDAHGAGVKSAANQVFVTGGAAQLLLLPPAQPGKGDIAVVSGAVKAAITLDFTPNLRPLIGVGLVSASLNLRNLNPSALQPAQSTDVFENEIANVSSSFDSGKDDAAARTALFLKGKVLGSTLLTLAYDSDKPSDTTLFRDIQPDQFYPVYGDSSARGFDAQSTGKLYVMVQNGTNYALYGDYTTQSDNPARQLTQYARALNGVKEHWQFGNVTVDGFASDTSSSQSIIEFRANGTSGPFQLDLRGVTNSQQVDIISRDRNQPSVILNDTPLTPFTDYAIEPYTGLLLLTNPVPSVDANLNPVYIHVSYSLDTGGPKHWVEGADARLQVIPGLALGATAIHDADPGNELTLQGVNLTEKLDAHTTAIAELARSSSDVQGDGSGERVDLQHDDGRLQMHLWGTHTDADFYNPNSLQQAGESEYGLKGAYRLDDADRFVANVLRTSDSVTGADQTGADVRLEHTLRGKAKVEVGVLHSEANAASALSAPALPGMISPTTPVAPVLPAGTDNAEAGYTAALAKVTVPVPDVKGAEAFALAEKAVAGEGEEYGVGGTYALNATTHLYAQHDFINSLNGPYTLDPSVQQYTTVAGLSTTLPDNTQLFDEYRVGDGIDGRSSEAATGLRQQWKLDDGIGLSASAQRVEPLGGVITDAATALTLGANYTAAHDWKASSQAQWETSTSSHTWLFTAGVAYKLDASWTLLERVLYTKQTDLAGYVTADDGTSTTSTASATSETSGPQGRELARVQSGFAYRPVNTDVWNALGQVEYLRDFDTTLGTGLNLDEVAWIVAGNVNIQPTRFWEITARYAAKRAIDWTDGFAGTTLTQLAGARSTWDVNPRWDAGLQGYALWGNGDSQYAVGPVVGYLVWKNLWVSLGYNVQGFSAPDLSGEAYTMRGVYLRVNLKFDESLLAGTPVASRDSTAHGNFAVRAP